MINVGALFDAGCDLAFDRFVDGTKQRSLYTGLLTAAAIALGLLFVWVLVHQTNGTSNVFTHVMYVPIIIATLTLGLLGGVVTAALGGVLLGPMMPLNVELGIAQTPENAAYRAFFFVLIAMTTGAFASISRRRHRELLASRARLSDHLARILRLLAGLVAERNAQTGEHCERVARNAVAIGRALRLEKAELKTYYWAGLLHDLGKLNVPEGILRSPNRLTEAEFAIVRQHAAYGADLLAGISDSFADIALGVRTHHERWDGSGYPDGLRGEEIPLLGRVLAVVDVFEAITERRPYRGPMSRTEARQLIAEGAGTQFDPMVVALLLRLEQMGKVTVATETDVWDAASREAAEEGTEGPRTLFDWTPVTSSP